jgi:hypothetical protein
MANRPLPTPEILRQLLRYEPETGKLFWRERPACMFTRRRLFEGWNTRFAGKEAATPASGTAHLSLVVLGTRYLAHRVIWRMVYGDEPHRIDHRDLDGCNNRLGNMRAATVAQNGMNRGAPSNNTSGVKGVSYRKDTGKWSAKIVANNKIQNLGCYKSLEDAASAYRQAALKLHGEFANATAYNP